MHGAFSTFLTELLENGLTAEVATTVPIYMRCFPSSVDYVLKSIPAKVTNYLCRFANSNAVIAWTKANPDWQTQMKSSLLNGTFEAHLKMIREAIGASDVNYRFLQALGLVYGNQKGDS